MRLLIRLQRYRYEYSLGIAIDVDSGAGSRGAREGLLDGQQLRAELQDDQIGRHRGYREGGPCVGEASVVG